MAKIDSRNARLSEFNDILEQLNLDVKDIKDKIEEIANAENVEIDYGNDTMLDALDNIKGKPIEIDNANDMDAVLTADNVGRVYRYVGTSDANYTNGDLYEVEASE